MSSICGDSSSSIRKPRAAPGARSCSTIFGPTSADSGSSNPRPPPSIRCWKICAALPEEPPRTAMADKHLQFLDIPRKDPDKLGVEVRTKQFREIYSQYSAEAAAQQAGRCISCGNPFCE